MTTREVVSTTMRQDQQQVYRGEMSHLVAGALLIQLDKQRHSPILDQTSFVCIMVHCHMAQATGDGHNGILLLGSQLQFGGFALLAFILLGCLTPLQTQARGNVFKQSSWNTANGITPPPPPQLLSYECSNCLVRHRSCTSVHVQ